MTQIDSAFLARFLRLAAERLQAGRATLSALDGEIGDGDHGTTMATGFAELSHVWRHATAEPYSIMRAAGSVFLNTVGATVGPLYAEAFFTAGQRFDAGEINSYGDLLLAFAEGIQSRGKADLGDKTMLDVWMPAAMAAARDTANPLAEAVRAAEAARDATVTMIARKGRAARLKERSIGHVDPGAASAAMIIAAMAEAAEA